MSFISDNQNFWHLATIQAAALGLPVFFIGGKLAGEFGLGVAISSLCIGNLVLWLIALSMFAMTYTRAGEAENAMQNVFAYFGKTASWVASLILLFAFVTWFSLQIKTQMIFMERFLLNYPSWSPTSGIRLGIFFACITTFGAMGGIRFIRWVCLISFPLFFLYILYIFFTNVALEGISTKFEWSFYAVIAVVLLLLPGMINLPTFFRHARSRADGIMGLTLMTVFVTLMQAGSIWFSQAMKGGEMLLPYTIRTGWTLDLLVVLAFVILLTFCVNLVNVYFASAALETLTPNFANARGFAVIGLMGTLVYGLLQTASVLHAVEVLTTHYIGCLGVMLLAGYLLRLVTQHRPRPMEQHVNFICWGIGCAVATVLFFLVAEEGVSFIGGIVASALSFVLFVFVEETVWAVGRLVSKRGDE